MKTLLTRQGITFTVDDDVAAHIAGCRLDAIKANKGARYYIYVNDVHIARWLLEITDPLLEADHIDCNPLNNVRSNLRVVTKAQNQHNKGKRRDNTTGVKNVSYSAASGLYEVRVKLHGRQHFGGRFKLLEDAQKAATALREKLHGEYARG
jgi:HNH endonuclease